MMIRNVLLVITALCAGAAAQEQKAAALPEVWKNRVFTAEELSKYDGKEGRPVYVAVDGVVYDLSRSKLWKTGMHMKLHKAGTDLSSAIHKQAPKAIHKDGKILEKMPKVGVMVSPDTAKPAPAPAAPAPKPQAAAKPAEEAGPGAAERKHDAASEPPEKPALFAIHKIAPEEIGRETKCPVSGDKITVSDKTLALDLKGKTYYFSGQGALDKFKASPEKYGGWMDKLKNLIKRK